MDNIGAEVGQKMRSAIKAKLMELDCYVDDELPDYIMVMVANKRTKSQMNEDLNLFLSTKTSAFVNWLHIVLKKLKEVTVTNPDIYKKVSKRKSDEHGDVKTKKEKRDKKVKKEELQDFPDEKPSIKLDVEVDFSTEQQGEKSLTDDLPIIKKPLSENRKVIITSNVEDSTTQAVYEDNFDIPLLSDVQDCNEEDLDDIEKKIRTVKSRLGLLVESDDENPHTSVDKLVDTASQEEITVKEVTEEDNGNEETVEQNETNNLANSRQISILQNEITESQNKELEKLTSALENEDNLQEDLESYTPKRKDSADDFDINSKGDRSENESKQQEKKHERITFNPDELSPKRPSIRERLGRKSSISPERIERDRRRNSFYAGCDEEKFRRNEVHRDFKEWVALRQADDTRDRQEREREKQDRSWNRGGSSRERRDRSWDRRDNLWSRKEKIRDKSRDRYEKIREGRNRSRSPNRQMRSPSREGRNRSKETSNSHHSAKEREGKDASRDRIKDRARERSRSRPKDVKPEGLASKIVLSKISVPQKPADSERSDDEQVVREVPSLVRVKRTIRTGKAQPNKNLLLRAVAEAQRSVAQAPKSGMLSPKKTKSIQDRLGTPGGATSKTRKIDENEKNKLKSLLEQSRKNRILRRMMAREGCNSSEDEYIPKPVENKNRKEYDSSEGEYIPKPVRKVIVEEVPKYVPSTKASQEDSDDSDKSQSPKRQFIITLDGVDSIKKDLGLLEDEDKSGENEEKPPPPPPPPPKIISDGRKVHSPIVFNKTEFSTQSAVKSSLPINIPDKLPVVHPPLSIKNKERCKYWPGCRQGDKCEFVHPSQTCEMFPQCKFGDNCLYLHPKCKFGSSCTKKECPYDHNVVKSLSASKMLATTQNCKFYPNCTNLNCPFFHPKPCKYGKFCANLNDCPFLHNFNVKRSLSWKSK